MPLDIGELCANGRVHQRVYTDPELFELERKNLFGRTWLYLGHESQLEARGDFITVELAGQPIIVVKGEGGQIQAFFNRCAHRGALIRRQPHGNARLLDCAYHGWTFELDGRLKNIPAKERYANTEVLDDASKWGLMKIPRFASYRGFLFGSLSPDGPDLNEFLGPVAVNLDTMIDRSPAGEIEVWGSKFQLLKRNNWKVYLENLHDGAHALPTHISSIRAAQSAAETADSEWDRLQAYIIAANSQSPEAMGKLRTNCYPHGHSDMLAFRKTRPDTPQQREYEEALARRVGAEGLQRVLGVDRTNAIIYPSMSVQPNWMQLRLIVPLAVDLTRVDIWTFKLKGASDWVNRRIKTFTNAIHTPASLVRADDLENFERVQLGLGATEVEWVSAHSNQAGEPGPHGESTAMGERYVRNQFDAWMHLMQETRPADA